MISLLTAFCLFASVSVAGKSSDALPPQKATAARSVEQREPALIEASRTIWEHAELALKEHRSAALLADMIEAEGFEVKRGISEMPTAFLASWGTGSPVIAYLAEYDALPGLSQTVSTKQEVRIQGGGGHGCGHNLFGTASLGAAIGLKNAMEEHGLKGTVRLYGTPAEEQGIGKVFMVRDGLFDDVDACLSWHPSNRNAVSVQPSKALRSFEVTFYGRSAHAAAAPWDGVSALDAVEAFSTGINLLREHMPETARIHYVVTEGGEAPNVIPARARVWAFVRGKDWREQQKVYEHVKAIVKGADLMAWGEEHGQTERGFREAEIQVFTGLYDYNVNLALAQSVQNNLELLGAPTFNEEDQKFGRGLQRSFGFPAKGFSTFVVPFNPKRAPSPGGSTDVANISWVAPTIDLAVATWPIACPAHSWASTSASGSDPGLKAMIHASKILACAGVELLMTPKAIEDIRREFDKSRERFDYEAPVGPNDRPALPSHMRD